MRPETLAIRKALKTRFCAPEWALFFEVAEATGGACRSADAVAMNCYPSRGLRVHGVEIKSFRGDWLKEIRSPAKDEAVQRYCDHWWIAAPKGIVQAGEMPPTWGLLELHGSSLRQSVAAPLLDAHDLERPFVAALLRAAAGRASRELYDAIQEATKDEKAKIAERVKAAVAIEMRAHKQLAKDVEDFEAASGIKIANGWRGGKNVGRAVKLISDLGLTSTFSSVRSLAANARVFADQADAALAPIAESMADEEAEFS